ncbi:hypothetical protein FRC03_006404 [Tulasnella sp. 419]|nr:hypothetical protein FRC03_006404 [Tulasnella sp. 419]
MASTPSISSDAASKALALLLEDLKLREWGGIGDTQTMKESESTRESLERKAQELERALSGFTHHVRHSIAGFRRQQNTLAPIHRLPMETLQYIFLLHASETFLSGMNDSLVHNEKIRSRFNEEEEDDDHIPGYQDLDCAVALRLSRVCSHWHHAAASQPHIWSYLDTRYNQEATELYLERSNGTPLFITCPDRVGYRHESEFMKLVTPHLDRWKAFISYSRNNDLLMDLPKGDYSIPSLESFMVHTNAGALIKIPPQLYTRTPRLREFHGFDWLRLSPKVGSEVLSRLTSLSIQKDFGSRALNTEDYQLLFASCPRLQTALITEANDWDLRAQVELSMFSVKVPNLRSLYLHNLHPRLVTALLFSLLPNPSKLPLVKVIGSCDPDVSKQAFMDTSRLGGFMDLACRNMAGLSTSALAEDYYYGGGGMIQIWGESEGKLSTILEFAEYSDRFGEIAVSLFSPNRTSMLRELSLTTADNVAHNLAPNVNCFPHLEHLTITIMRQWNWLEKVINLITQFAFPDGGTESATSGPQLKYLSLKEAWTVVLEAMPELLNARHESTQTLLMDSGLLHRLEKLDVQLSKIRYSTDPLIDPGSASREIEMLLAPRGIAFELVNT